MFTNSTFVKSLTAVAVAAALGLSMSAAQARDFDHRGGHGFQHSQHYGHARYGHRSEHRSEHRRDERRFERHDGRR